MHDKVWGVGYRKGKYKLVEGIFEDLNYYHESQVDSLNFTMTEKYTWKYAVFSKFGEALLRWGSYAFGNGPFDSVRGAFLIAIVHKVGIAAQGSGSTYLFDIENDPSESFNLALIHPEIVEDLRRDVQAYRENKPHQGKYWLVLPHDEMQKTYAPGDCSMNPAIAPTDCIFKHPFFENRNQGDEGNFVHIIEEYTAVYARQFLSHFAGRLLLVADSIVALYFGVVFVVCILFK